MAASTLLAAEPTVTGMSGGSVATAERPVRHIRRLRLTAWALRRLLLDPGRVPGAWRTPWFCVRIDRVRTQLLPIRSLSALADSFAREHGAEDAEVRLAYGLRWLELSGVLDERPWRLHCARPPR